MSDVRNFDSLERVVRDQRRKLDDVESTVMARLATHTHAGGGSGSVSSVNGHTGAVVLGASDVSAQPLDSDLTTIAALAPADGTLIKRVTGSWAASTLTKSDVGLGSVDNTSDAGKPVSTAQQAALDLKAPLASPAFTGTPTGITKAHVGLGSVDNTSDLSKPVSTATQTALNGKVGSTSITTMVTLTQAAYNALTTPDPATLYVVVG